MKQIKAKGKNKKFFIQKMKNEKQRIRNLMLDICDGSFGDSYSAELLSDVKLLDKNIKKEIKAFKRQKRNRK